MLPPQGDIIDMRQVIASLPIHYERDQKWQAEGNAAAADRYTLQTPNRMTVNISDRGYVLSSQLDIDLSAAEFWDTTSPTDYTVAANRAGKDFYAYACQPDPPTGSTPEILLSANSTYPSGYTADNSRKVDGLHCLCVDVGTIASHPLSDYVAGDILPASVWDLRHRPVSSPAGMVFDSGIDKWADIYLASGTGVHTASVYGGTISDVRTWLDFVDDGLAVGKRLPHDFEFQSLAAGSNEETNVLGSADPVTTGGHLDTGNRRMISDIGCCDCCGVMWQWLLDQSFRVDGSSWAWYNLPGAKGSLYRQGTYGDVKLLAGGIWSDGADSGSRARHAVDYRWHTGTGIGARFLAEPLRGLPTTN